jgi:hypothetical protein
MDQNTIVSFYGRAFSPHPSMDKVGILGRLSFYDDFDQFYAAVTEYAQEINDANGDLGVIPAMNIIYELASGSKDSGGGTFLIGVEGYLEATDAGTLEDNYLKPAQDKGVLVFLDDQLGLSSVEEQAREMLPYLLKYDNVHFFFDPEFHIYPEQYDSGEVTIPGRPIPGHIDADDVNAALNLIDQFKQENGITREVIVGLHQFEDLNVSTDTRTMILDKERISIPPGITLIFDADGFSPSEHSQQIKLAKYVGITDSGVYPMFHDGAFPGIKIFPPNPYLTQSRYDYDVFSPRQLMGLDPLTGGGLFAPPPAFVLRN